MIPINTAQSLFILSIAIILAIWAISIHAYIMYRRRIDNLDARQKEQDEKEAALNTKEQELAETTNELERREHWLKDKVLAIKESLKRMEERTNELNEQEKELEQRVATFNEEESADQQRLTDWENDLKRREQVMSDLWDDIDRKEAIQSQNAKAQIPAPQSQSPAVLSQVHTPHTTEENDICPIDKTMTTIENCLQTTANIFTTIKPTVNAIANGTMAQSIVNQICDGIDKTKQQISTFAESDCKTMMHDEACQRLQHDIIEYWLSQSGWANMTLLLSSYCHIPSVMDALATQGIKCEDIDTAHQQLNTIMDKVNIKTIVPQVLTDEFNPEIHEAVNRETRINQICPTITPQDYTNKVFDIVQVGYETNNETHKPKVKYY